MLFDKLRYTTGKKHSQTCNFRDSHKKREEEIHARLIATLTGTFLEKLATQTKAT